MDNWRVIDLIGFHGTLQYRRGNVLVCPDDDSQPGQLLPLRDVGTILVGLHCGLGPTVLQQLAHSDVVTLFCDWNGVPASAASGWSDHGRVGARQRAQFEMSIPRRKNGWQQIIRAKISGQAATLRALGDRDWRHLNDMTKLVHSGDPENVEGRAAAYYWRRVLGKDFVRLPGDAADHRNAFLNYAYAVLRGHGVRAVAGAGLSASLGFFHRGRSNAFNLVDDLIEPFRPAIDFGVATTPASMSIAHPSVKHRLVQASEQAFGPDGLAVRSVLADFCQWVGRYVEGCGDRLVVPIWGGPVKTKDVLLEWDVAA